MLKKYIEQIKEADMIAVGIGRELSAEKLIPYDSDEVRDYYKNQGMHGYEELLSREPDISRDKMLEIYYRNYLLSVEHVPYFDDLTRALEGKNYFIITSNKDNLLYKSGLRSDRIVVPCGSGEFLQCITPCEHKIYPAITGTKSLIAYFEKSGQYDILQCPKCEKELVFNIRREETAGRYLEEGYLQMWGNYTKWLQGTINKKVLLLELGEGFELPDLFKWPFEKIAFYNKKARLIRVHEHFYQAGEEISDKTEPVAMNSREFLEKREEN
jgi:NAD-dependent SIR2 family protein deacetylase